MPGLLPKSYLALLKIQSTGLYKPLGGELGIKSDFVRLDKTKKSQF